MHTIFRQTTMGFVLILFILGLTPVKVKAFNQNNACLGAIEIFAGTFDPENWMSCDGRLLRISTNCALYSLLGCQYGGDCRSSFALPDLRGRIPIGAGQGAGLTRRNLAEKGGEENHSLSPNEISSATKPITKNAGNDTEIPGIGTASPHNNMAPYLGVRYIICVRGTYPTRN